MQTELSSYFLKKMPPVTFTADSDSEDDESENEMRDSEDERGKGEMPMKKSEGGPSSIGSPAGYKDPTLSPKNMGKGGSSDEDSIDLDDSDDGDTSEGMESGSDSESVDEIPMDDQRGGSSDEDNIDLDDSDDGENEEGEDSIDLDPTNSDGEHPQKRLKLDPKQRFTDLTITPHVTLVDAKMAFEDEKNADLKESYIAAVERVYFPSLRKHKRLLTIRKKDKTPFNNDFVEIYAIIKHLNDIFKDRLKGTYKFEYGGGRPDLKTEEEVLNNKLVKTIDLQKIQKIQIPKPKTAKEIAAAKSAKEKKKAQERHAAKKARRNKWKKAKAMEAARKLKAEEKKRELEQDAEDNAYKSHMKFFVAESWSKKQTFLKYSSLPLESRYLMLVTNADRQELIPLDRHVAERLESGESVYYDLDYDTFCWHYYDLYRQVYNEHPVSLDTLSVETLLEGPCEALTQLKLFEGQGALAGEMRPIFPVYRGCTATLVNRWDDKWGTWIPAWRKYAIDRLKKTHEEMRAQYLRDIHTCEHAKEIERVFNHDEIQTAANYHYHKEIFRKKFPTLLFADVIRSTETARYNREQVVSFFIEWLCYSYSESSGTNNKFDNFLKLLRFCLIKFDKRNDIALRTMMYKALAARDTSKKPTGTLSKSYNNFPDHLYPILVKFMSQGEFEKACSTISTDAKDKEVTFSSDDIEKLKTLYKEANNEDDEDDD